MLTLNNLELGKSARIVSISHKGASRQHLLDMGLIPGTIVKFTKLAPLGDPMEIKLRGYSLSLRIDDAKTIKIEECKEEEYYTLASKKDNNHPGLGEDGKFHNKKTEKALPEDQILVFALMGNQNAGKTTLFNQLTGSNQHVGNFPGVTVERKDGPIRNHPETLLVDLPGIYSMSPYSPEELISRDYILNNHPQAIINVLDATSIERGLYLTMQLLELDIPMVLALNMMDEIDNNGGYVDINGLEAELGIPVVPISAAQNQGIDELIEHAIHIARYQEKPTKQDYCDAKTNGAVHRCLHSIMHMIEDHVSAKNLPLRFCASKAAENDKQIIKMLDLDKNEIETLEHITKQMEDERGLDKAAAIAEMRYSFISRISKNNVIKPKESLEEVRTNKIDKILTGKYTAIPCFIFIMLSVFFLSFEIIGPFLQKFIEIGIGSLTTLVDKWLLTNNISIGLHSLIIDGIFSSIGTVLSFLPIIIVLFFFLSILEDSGYMARVAFFMDKLLRKIGLSGRSIVPMIVGFGCSVPAVMSARTLPSERDRKLTILLIPFISCSAKLPIYSFFVSTFFTNYSALIMLFLYLTGIAIGILVALLFKNTLFKGEAVPFIMELPSYRLPSPKNVGQLLWEKAKDFLQRAFTVIFLASVIIWFLQHFSFNMHMVSNTEDSMLAIIASYIAPVLSPLGFGNWKIAVSLITGFLAKEAVVSSLLVLFPAGGLAKYLNIANALSLLVFCLLYVPCIATIAAIKRELGTKWSIFVIIFQCLVAWVFSFVVYSIVSLFII